MKCAEGSPSPKPDGSLLDSWFVDAAFCFLRGVAWGHAGSQESQCHCREQPEESWETGGCDNSTPGALMSIFWNVDAFFLTAATQHFALPPAARARLWAAFPSQGLHSCCVPVLNQQQQQLFTQPPISMRAEHLAGDREGSRCSPFTGTPVWHGGCAAVRN